MTHHPNDRPNDVHYKAALQFAQTVQLSKSNSSTGSVWMDNDNREDGEIPHSECGVGLLHALFYGDRYHAAAESIFRSLGLVNKKDPYYDLVVRPKALKLDRCVWNRHAADAATCESVHGDTGKHLCSNAKITASGDGECSCC